MASFKENVIKLIQSVPKGRVVSYGQVAAAAGSPRAARQVGGILRALDLTKTPVPWWRVINNQGIISIKGNWIATKETQKELLEKEGIEVNKDYSINMDKYRFQLKTL